MKSVASYEIEITHPEVQKWLGKGAEIIAAASRQANLYLIVVSKRGDEYQVTRAFVKNRGTLIADDAEVPVSVSVDLRTTDAHAVIQHFVEQ